MKISILLSILLISTQTLPAQTLTRSVLPAAGESSNPQLRWTLGEIATTRSTAGGYTLSQGFQQSVLVQITTQIIQLSQGWNLISSFIQPTNPNMVSVFSGIAGQVLLVKDADGKIYAPSQGNLNTIGNWSVHKGYQVKTNQATSLTITGTQIQPQNTPIAIQSGWQIIPYFRTSAGGAVAMLSTIQGNLIIVKNNAGQVFTLSPTQINTIGNLLAGQGYWLKSNGNGTLIYPTN